MTYDKYSKNDRYEKYIHICVEEDNINEETTNLADRVFESKINYCNFYETQIEHIVNYIRIIFKDYNLKEISIVLKSKDKYVGITIQDNKVINYNEKINESFGIVGFEYNTNGINLSFDNNDSRKINDSKYFTEFFDKSMKIINNINENKKIKLTDNDLKIITLYYEFFNKIPDLSKEDYLKVQPMMCLIECNDLDYYNLPFGDYTLRYGGKPKSYNLNEIMNNIVPHGSTELDSNINKYVDSNKKYNSNIQIKIENMGKIVNEYINAYKNPQEILDNIATVSYIIRYVVSKYYEIEDIVSASKDKINYEQVEEIVEFLTNLNNALETEKPYETYHELIKNSKNKIKNIHK